MLSLRWQDNRVGPKIKGQKFQTETLPPRDGEAFPRTKDLQPAGSYRPRGFMPLWGLAARARRVRRMMDWGAGRACDRDTRDGSHQRAMRRECDALVVGR